MGLRGLTEWCHDLGARLVQLEEWVGNPMEIPDVTWISGLINPQSFLTAICQVTAQKNQLELTSWWCRQKCCGTCARKWTGRAPTARTFTGCRCRARDGTHQTQCWRSPSPRRCTAPCLCSTAAPSSRSG